MVDFEKFEVKTKEQMMEGLLHKREGPEFIRPAPPKPYLSCKGCQYFVQDMIHSGGLRGSPKYAHYCAHPIYQVSNPFNGARRLDDFGSRFDGTSSNKVVTPKWCPYLEEQGESE